MGSEKYGATTLFYRESISSPRLPSLRANSGRLSVRQRFWVTDLRLCMYNIQYWLLSDTKAPTERENGWISTPTKIMIIRHAEKPPKHSNQDGPWDVLVNG